MRFAERPLDSLRPMEIVLDFQSYAEGSVLISQGNTRVICSVSVEEIVPGFLRGTGQGWITAEYGMLPRSTHTRTQREAASGRQTGRSQEIQRLIGRSLRSVADLDALGERTLRVDCDVIQADGGTRTASITGAYVALELAMERLVASATLARMPLLDRVAATSVGIVDGNLMLDLDYQEDSSASVDFNVVMTGKGDFVEIQGTAERDPFSKNDMDTLVGLAQQGIYELFELQKRALTQR